MSSTFVAIDFETANSVRASACQVGLARFEGGKVVATFETLLKPHPTFGHFDPINTSIHGIRESDVSEAPEFDATWGELHEFIGRSHLVAHNAGFDMSVLRGLFDTYRLEYPTIDYFCTLMLSRNLLEPAELNLKFVAASLGIEIEKHHDALADAIAAGSIAASLVDRFGGETLIGLAEIARIKPGRFSESGWRGSSTRPTGPGASGESLKDMKERLADDIDCEGPLAGLTLVITGVLPGMTRNEAYELIVMAGGEWGSAVTKTTDYLVDGDNAGETNKTRRVYELREKGVNVAILNAEGFFGLVSP